MLANSNAGSSGCNAAFFIDAAPTLNGVPVAAPPAGRRLLQKGAAGVITPGVSFGMSFKIDGLGNPSALRLHPSFFSFICFLTHETIL